MKQVILPKPSVGICIATHGSIAYVHLGLESLRRNEPDCPVLVHDDSSDQGRELKALCEKYGAAFVSTPFRLCPTVGDLSAYAEGLRWAHENGLEIVVKCSRRFILNKPWIAGLQELAHNLQYATYCAPCGHFGFGFRSELCGVHVPSWIASGAFARMVETARRNQPYDSLPEAWYHNRARDVHQFIHPQAEELSHSQNPNDPKCDIVVRSERFYPRPGTYDCFAWWPLMGLSRCQKMPGILWHDSHNPTDYCTLAHEFELPYLQSDFELVPGQ
jgi:hypothetical protein